MKTYYVYILTNMGRTVLYVGVTNDLYRRATEHYFGMNLKKSFAGRYNVFNIIYFEEFSSIRKAIAREKEIKRWGRVKKEQLIAKVNPTWKFLNKLLFSEWPPTGSEARRVD